MPSLTVAFTSSWSSSSRFRSPASARRFTSTSKSPGSCLARANATGNSRPAFHHGSAPTGRRVDDHGYASSNDSGSPRGEPLLRPHIPEHPNKLGSLCRLRRRRILYAAAHRPPPGPGCLGRLGLRLVSRGLLEPHPVGSWIG